MCSLGNLQSLLIRTTGICPRGTTEEFGSGDARADRIKSSDSENVSPAGLSQPAIVVSRGRQVCGGGNIPDETPSWYLNEHRFGVRVAAVVGLIPGIICGEMCAAKDVS